MNTSSRRQTECPLRDQKGDIWREVRQRTRCADSGRSPDRNGTARFDPLAIVHGCELVMALGDRRDNRAPRPAPTRTKTKGVIINVLMSPGPRQHIIVSGSCEGTYWLINSRWLIKQMPVWLIKLKMVNEKGCRRAIFQLLSTWSHDI
jgi:hypothetical protein